MRRVIVAWRRGWTTLEPRRVMNWKINNTCHPERSSGCATRSRRVVEGPGRRQTWLECFKAFSPAPENKTEFLEADKWEFPERPLANEVSAGSFDSGFRPRSG